jgi:hypothetical protein
VVEPLGKANAVSAVNAVVRGGVIAVGYCCLGAPGIAMSRVVTLPRPESGGVISELLPTTTMASLSGWTYFWATRVMSAAVTFSTPVR